MVKPADEDMSMLINFKASVFSIYASATEAFGFWIMVPRFDLLKLLVVLVFHKVETGEFMRFIVFSNVGSLHSLVRYGAKGTWSPLFLMVTLQNPSARLISLSLRVIKSTIALKMWPRVSLTTSVRIWQAFAIGTGLA